MLYSSITPQTVLLATETYMTRSGKSRGFTFLRVYRDLDALGKRSPWLYHVAYAMGDGQLSTSFRLAHEPVDFRANRAGKLLHASYVLHPTVAGGAPL
jgi:hypothetical protein